MIIRKSALKALRHMPEPIA